MTSSPHTQYPWAKIRRRTALSFIWLVPVIAAAVAIVLVIQNLHKLGPVVTIQFKNANGLDPNQTLVRYRGIRVGSVKSIQLSPDLQHVEVRARLTRSATGLAREGSIFWIVRPEVGTAGVHALETIVSGPYIEVLPGNPDGKVLDRFIGAEQAPVIRTPNDGIEFILHTAQIRSLGPGSPVFYRGLQAGSVLFLDLSPNSKTVKIHVLIKPNFTSLVRHNSVWWNAGGVDINWHLLSGLNMSAENLKSVITGGIAFATPNEPATPAVAGTTFELYDRPNTKWFEWAPDMTVTNAAVTTPGNSDGVDLENVNDQMPKPK